MRISDWSSDVCSSDLIVQGTYETFAEVARRHFSGDPSGKWILTAGLGGMGGSQPLAAVMAGFSCLAIECRPSRIEMRLKTGYLDRQARALEEALASVRAAQAPVSVGLPGNGADHYPDLAMHGVPPVVLNRQTSVQGRQGINLI